MNWCVKCCRLVMILARFLISSPLYNERHYLAIFNSLTYTHCWCWQLHKWVIVYDLTINATTIIYCGCWSKENGHITWCIVDASTSCHRMPDLVTLAPGEEYEDKCIWGHSVCPSVRMHNTKNYCYNLPWFFYTIRIIPIARSSKMIRIWTQ